VWFIKPASKEVMTGVGRFFKAEPSVSDPRNAGSSTGAWKIPAVQWEEDQVFKVIIKGLETEEHGENNGKG
jgi:hypothetical protein